MTFQLSKKIHKDSNLFWLLFAGIIIRVCVAVTRNDLVWPDEHFMTLEPASKIVFDRAYLAWEWQEGYRAWTLPLLYVPVLLICKMVGITGGLIPIYASRLFTALIAGGSLLKWDEILRLARLRPWARTLSFAGLALGGPMVFWGVTCLGDHWLMMAWMVLIPTIYRLSSRNSDWDWVRVGLLAGMPILIKYQAGIFALALGLGFLVQRKTLRQLSFFSLGVLVHPVLMGLLDWMTYGQLFSSLIQQVSRGEDTSRFYGVDSWYDYFPRLFNDQGIFFFALLGILLGVCLVRWRATTQFASTRGRILWMILGPALLYFLFHIRIPHKETRFLVPILPALYFLLGVGLHLTPGLVFLRRLSFKWSLPAWGRPLLVGGIGGISLFWIWNTPTYLTSVNIAPLEAQVYRLQKSSGGGSSCLLLLDHHWSWTRGRLILGGGVDVIEKHVSEISPGQDSGCLYAILPASKMSEFQARVSSGSWSFVEGAPSGYVLLQKFHI